MIAQSIDIQSADGRALNFDFTVEQNLSPILTLNGGREFAWDAETLLATRGDGWSYDIQPARNRFSYAKIKRTKDGKAQGWFENTNLIRKVLQASDKENVVLYAADYDHAHRVTRVQSQSGDSYAVTYGENTVLATDGRGTVAYRKEVNPRSAVSVEAYSNGATRTKRDLGDGKRSDVRRFSDGTIEERIYQDETIISSKTYRE